MLNDRILFAALLVILTGCQPGATKTVSFKSDVEPILAKNCIVCHSEGGPGARKSGVRLDGYNNLMSARVVTPGDITKSPLVTVILPTADHSKSMPMRGEKLSKSQVELIENWIAQGAKNN